MNNQKIDIVIIWVDPSDENWYKEFKKYNPKKIDSSNDESRFRDWGTLKYVFRGIDKFLPWINKIHFITAGHKPEWLDTNNSKINFLSHKDIYINKKNLPVFNSSSIELNFLGIKDLADKFIYFNDDMLVLKPTKIERFFKDNLPVDFLIQGIPRRGIIYNKIFKPEVWQKNICNNIDLINKKYIKKELGNSYFNNKSYGLKNKLKNKFFNLFSRYGHIEHYHHPQPYLKQTLEKTYIAYKEEIDYTCSQKFRTEKDLTIYINRYWQLCSGNFYPKYYNDFYTVNIKNEETAKIALEKMKDMRFLCLNDSKDLKKEYSRIKKIVMDGLETILPDKCQYEK